MSPEKSRGGGDVPRYSAVPNAAASAVSSAPSISRRFTRDAAPEAMRTDDRGTFSDLAMSAITAALAAPSDAAAETRSLRIGRPASSCVQPSTASRPPFGVTRTASRAVSRPPR